MNNWGETFYDHYCKYLGEPKRRDIYRVADDAPSIQILSYSNVFPDCEVLCSLGLSQFGANIGNVAEVSLVTDLVAEECSKILANALFFLVDRQMRIGRGVAVGGINTIVGEFSAKYQKSAIYFTYPTMFPEGFGEVLAPEKTDPGRVYWAFFLSQQEYQFFKERGSQEFEALLEEKGIDPFSIQRGSAI